MSNIIIPKEHQSFTKDRPKVQGKTTIGDGLPRQSVFNEDVQHLKAMFSREGMAALTNGGGVGLHQALEYLEFDLNMPYERVENYPTIGMTTFFQYKEW